MTQPASTAPLPQHVGVVNVGLSLFADAVASQGAPVISVDWRVPAGGQPALVAALGRLYGQHGERIEASNAEVLRRLDSGAPGPSAVAIGPTTRCAFAGLSPIRSLPSSSSASAGLAAQPSATVAACMDLRSGSGASA